MHAQSRIVPRASAGDNTPGFEFNTAEESESELFKCLLEADLPLGLWAAPLRGEL